MQTAAPLLQTVQVRLPRCCCVLPMLLLRSTSTPVQNEMLSCTVPAMLLRADDGDGGDTQETTDGRDGMLPAASAADEMLSASTVWKVQDALLPAADVGSADEKIPCGVRLAVLSSATASAADGLLHAADVVIASVPNKKHCYLFHMYRFIIYSSPLMCLCVFVFVFAYV